MDAVSTAKYMTHRKTPIFDRYHYGFIIVMVSLIVNNRDNNAVVTDFLIHRNKHPLILIMQWNTVMHSVLERPTIDNPLPYHAISPFH